MLLRVLLATVGVVYAFALLLRPEAWRRVMGGGRQAVPEWFPYLIAAGALMWSVLVLTTGLFGAL